MIRSADQEVSLTEDASCTSFVVLPYSFTTSHLILFAP